MRMQHPVDVREARSRHHALDVDAAVLLDQRRGERLFVGVARCEVDVPAFRCARHQTSVDARQRGDAEAGARGNQRDVAVRIRLPFVQHFNLVGREHRHRPRQRLEIVEQIGPRNRHLDAQRVEVDDPRHVRQLRARSGHGTCHAEARGLDIRRLGRRLAKKLDAQRAEIGKVERAVRADLDGAGALGPAREEAEKGFRSADVACKQHR